MTVHEKIKQGSLKHVYIEKLNSSVYNCFK